MPSTDPEGLLDNLFLKISVKIGMVFVLPLSVGKYDSIDSSISFGFQLFQLRLEKVPKCRWVIGYGTRLNFEVGDNHGNANPTS